VSGLSPVEPIGTGHDLTAFDSGELELDAWLTQRALDNHARGFTKTYVVHRASKVVGFYALAMASVSRADTPAAVGDRGPTKVPVALLARLAVDRSEQGQGLGAALLKDAILRATVLAEAIGARALLAHAKHDTARSFYEHFDFEPSPTDPLHMYLLLGSAA
jgi:GNAT superfamily N-acetyltransferase